MGVLSACMLVPCLHCPQKSEEGVGPSNYFSVSVIKHDDQGSLKKNLFGVMTGKNPLWWGSMAVSGRHGGQSRVPRAHP